MQGVVGAATGAGVIIGTYFAFYSTTKRFLRSNTTLNDGACWGRHAAQLARRSVEACSLVEPWEAHGAAGAWRLFGCFFVMD